MGFVFLPLISLYKKDGYGVTKPSQFCCLQGSSDFLFDPLFEKRMLCWQTPTWEHFVYSLDSCTVEFSEYLVCEKGYTHESSNSIAQHRLIGQCGIGSFYCWERLVYVLESSVSCILCYQFLIQWILVLWNLAWIQYGICHFTGMKLERYFKHAS